MKYIRKKKNIFIIVGIIIFVCIATFLSINHKQEEKKIENDNVSESKPSYNLFNDGPSKSKIEHYFFSSCSDITLEEILYALDYQSVNYKLQFTDIDEKRYAVLNIGTNGFLLNALIDYENEEQKKLNIISGSIMNDNKTPAQLEEKICSYQPKEKNYLSGSFAGSSEMGYHKITFYNDMTCKIELNLKPWYLENYYEDCHYSFAFDSRLLTFRIYDLTISVRVKGQMKDSIEKLKFKLYTESYYVPIKLVPSNYETCSNLEIINIESGKETILKYIS